MAMPVSALAQLEAALFSALEGATHVSVAFSGGVDSSVMAYLLGRYQRSHPHCHCRLLHVHHGLSANADQWLSHCQTQARQWGLPFEGHPVTLALGPRVSIEAAARTARYQVFQQALTHNERLLTGHHQDDQAETLLLALKRGSGPTGLAAMAVCQPLGRGALVRPWLAFSRATIEAAAEALGLQHITDESNQDDRFDRNFLRNQVMPLLRTRWPSVHASISRSAQLCAEQQALCDEIAHIDWVQCRLPATQGMGLKLSACADFSEPRRNNLLRYFLRKQQVVLPTFRQLQQLQQMWQARVDAQPQLDWDKWSLRRYLDGLYLLPQQVPEPLTAHPFGDGRLANGQHWQWQMGVAGLRLPMDKSRLIVRYNLPGSTELHPQGRHKKRTLKKLWQEYQVPPWQRPQVAMLCQGDRVLAALGYWLEQSALSNQAEEQSGLPILMPT